MAASGSVLEFGAWGAVFIALGEALSAVASASVTVVLFF